MALALYRKYRPARLAEVVGQEHVTDPLATALTAGRINHAYLFSGPRGCGKTSSARILARSLNCVQGPTADPCGECESCIALAPEGPGSIDVVELDAASHGGVEDARELRDRAFYAPAESRYRVFIVDEAHMVTTQGFNALLKIVEEPPDHLVFVFATTEPDKVLPTIRSRTHHYPFRLIPPGTMRSLLERICDDEDVTVAPPVYPLVIRAGGGSARDTLSVLDQLLAGAGPEGVTYERAVALLGVTDAALIDDTVDALAAGDGAAVYQAVDRLVEAGHDPRRFAADLLQRLRDLMLVQAVPDAAARGLVDGAEDELERMTDQAARLGPATLARYGEIVHNGLIEMRGATAPRLLLELLCARMLLPAATTSDPGLLERLERIERRNAIAPDARPDEDGGRQQFVRPSRRGDGGSAEPVASGAAEASAPQRPAPREQPSTAESREPSSSDGSTGTGPSGSGRAASASSRAATPGDAPAPSEQAPAPERPGTGSGEGADEGRQASPGRSAGQQVSERLAAGASTETAGASPSGGSADTPATPMAGDAAAAPATSNASADPAVADSSAGPATAGMSAEPTAADASARAATAGVAAESAAADASGGAATADSSAEPAAAAARAEPTTADVSADPAAAGARAGAAAEPSAEPAAAGARAGAATAGVSAEPAAADAPAATAELSAEPGAADAPAGATATDAPAGAAAGETPAAAAAGETPAGAVVGEAPAGAVVGEAPAVGAASETPAGGAAAVRPAEGAATEMPAGGAAAVRPAEGAATDASAVSAANDPSATDTEASGNSDAPAASASAAAPTASADSGTPAGPPGADAPRQPRDGAPPDAAPPESARPAPSPASLDAAAVRRVWSEILAAARQRSRSTEALLVNATVRAVDGDTLVLTIGSPPLARRLSEPRNTDVIADALHAVLGVRWTVRCDQGDGPAPSRQANTRPESRTRQAPTRPSARDAGLPDPATARPSQGEGEAGSSSTRPASTDRREGPGDPALGAAERSRSGSRGNGRAAPDGGEPLPPEPPPEDAPPDVDDEESMMAEAAADTAPAGARRDPEVAAMELLSNELGARTIDRG